MAGLPPIASGAATDKAGKVASPLSDTCFALVNPHRGFVPVLYRGENKTPTALEIDAVLKNRSFQDSCRKSWSGQRLDSISSPARLAKIRFLGAKLRFLGDRAPFCAQRRLSERLSLITKLPNSKTHRERSRALPGPFNRLRATHVHAYSSVRLSIAHRSANATTDLATLWGGSDLAAASKLRAEVRHG